MSPAASRRWSCPTPLGGALSGALLWLGLVGSLACAPAEEGEAAVAPGALHDLGTALVFDSSLLVVPGPRWSPQGGGGTAEEPPSADDRWVFRSFSRLLCQVARQPEGALKLRLLPDDETAGHLFDADWDGEPIDAAMVGKVGAEIEIAIAPERLAPGLHQLVIRRRHAAGRPRREVRHDNIFERLAYQVNGQERVISPADRPTSFLLAELLLHGVVGRQQERRSGLAFVGPGQHRVELPEGGAGHLVVEPENFSLRPARYRVSDGAQRVEARLAAGERTRLELEVAEQAHSLTFEVLADGDGGTTDGEASDADAATGLAGLHLWGEPIYRPRLSAAGERPPIILITLDTTRRDALGPYRQPGPDGEPDPSPEISRWAAAATVFELAHSTAPWTLPSHASIFTGLYPSRHRAGTRDVQLPVGVPTLAALLRQRGYLTLGISAGELSSSRFGLAQGFHAYRNPDQFETSGEQVDQYAGDLLEQHADTPFFLWINYFDPHALYRAPAEYGERFQVAQRAAALADLEGWNRLARGDMGVWRSAVEGELEVTPAVADYLRAAYLAEIAWTDHLIGRLLERLEKVDLYDRALIIVTADHGELLGERGYVSHGARLDPELVEIPLIIKWPGQRQGERDPRLVSLVDLFPTVLGVAGIEPPPNDGHALLRGARDELHRFTVLEEHEILVHPLPRFMKVASSLYGIQRPTFRQLVWEGGEECARLRQGRWQGEPCTTPGATVLSSLEELLGDTSTALGATAEGGLSAAEKESLQALGYL